jgi:hypothetical protein
MSDDALHGVWVTWNSVKAQLLAEARGELSKTTGALGSGTVDGVDTETFLSKVTNTLFTLGISAKDGLVSITNLAVKNFTAEKSDVKIARISKMEMVATNGDIYCTWIGEDGEWVKTKGDCTSSDVAVAIPTTQTVVQSQEIVQQAQQAANNALESAQNAEQAIQEQVESVVSQAVEAANQSVEQKIEEKVEEKLKEKEEKEEKNKEEEPEAVTTPGVNEISTPGVTEMPLPEVQPETVPEPIFEGVGEAIQESAAGLLNAIIDFLKGIIKLTVKKVAELPIMKNATASILQNSEKLKAELSSDKIPKFTAGLLSPMQNLINRLFEK